MTTFPWLLTSRSASVRIGSKLYQTDAKNPAWPKIAAMLQSSEHDAKKLQRWMTPQLALVASGRGLIEVDSKGLRYRGQPVNAALSQRVVQVLDEGDDLLPWFAFVDKVMLSKSQATREELYLFLQEQKLPLCIDGDFLAYKIVRDGYLDCHSGTVDYSIGRTATMKRSEVDADRRALCSTGLHFCSKDYLYSGSVSGPRIITVKVDPRDVVAIPEDHNNAKGRAWRLESVGELLDGKLSIPGMEMEALTDTTVWNVNVTTASHGIMTRNRLRRLRKEHGSWAAVASTLNVGSGTVSAWVSKLGLTKAATA